MTTPTAEVLDRGPAPTPGRVVEGAVALLRRRRARRPGWIVKIVLLGLADAIALLGLLIAFNEEAWGYFAVLAGHAGRAQRGVPPSALRADEVPAAGRCSSCSASACTRCCTRPTRRRRTTAPASCCPKDQAIDQIQSQSISRPRAPRPSTSRRWPDGSDASPATASSTRRPSEVFLGTEDGLEPLEDDGRDCRCCRRPGGRSSSASATSPACDPATSTRCAGYPSDPETLPDPRARPRARRSASPAARRSRARRRWSTTPTTAR